MNETSADALPIVFHWSDPRILILGGDPVDNTAGYAQIQCVTISGRPCAAQWRAEVVTNAASVRFRLLSTNGRVRIDGEDIELPNGAVHVGRDFGSRARRTVVIQGSGADFGGVSIDEGTIEAPPPARCMFAMGDSFTAGLHTIPFDAYPHLIGPRLGYRDVRNNGIGGTGFCRSLGQTTFRERLGDLWRARPALITVSGGYEHEGDTPAEALTEAVAATLGDIRAAMPDVPLICLGCLGGTVPADISLRSEVAIRAGAARVGGVQFVPVMTAAEGPWFTPENCRRFISDDGVHPNAAGQSMIADKLEVAIKPVLSERQLN